MSFRTSTACTLATRSGFGITGEWVASDEDWVLTKRRLPLTRSVMEAQTPSTTHGEYETDARYRTAATHSGSRFSCSWPERNRPAQGSFRNTGPADGLRSARASRRSCPS